MARQKKGSGRVTTPRPTHDVNDEILPLRRRNPLMFWFIMIAVLAMVLSTFAGFATLL
jgi:hypothetical protein